MRAVEAALLRELLAEPSAQRDAALLRVAAELLSAHGVARVSVSDEVEAHLAEAAGACGTAHRAGAGARGASAALIAAAAEEEDDGGADGGGSYASGSESSESV
jgi:hypothetical protein